MIGLPAAILDARGKVLAANSLIEALDSHLLWLPKDRIALIDPAANTLLRGAVAEINDPAAASVRSFPSKGAADAPVVVHLIPATGEARDIGKTRDGPDADNELTAVGACVGDGDRDLDAEFTWPEQQAMRSTPSSWALATTFGCSWLG